MSTVLTESPSSKIKRAQPAKTAPVTAVTGPTTSPRNRHSRSLNGNRVWLPHDASQMSRLRANALRGRSADGEGPGGGFALGRLHRYGRALMPHESEGTSMGVMIAALVKLATLISAASMAPAWLDLRRGLQR